MTTRHRISRKFTRGASFAAVAAALALAAALPAAAAQTGSYRGQAVDVDEGEGDGEVSFRVVKGGRLITGFKAAPIATCINPEVIGGIEVVEVPVAIDRIKVKKNGRFARELTFRAGPPSDARQTIRVSGRLRKSKVRGGSLILEQRCADQVAFTAKRR